MVVLGDQTGGDRVRQGVDRLPKLGLLVSEPHYRRLLAGLQVLPAAPVHVQTFCRELEEPAAELGRVTENVGCHDVQVVRHRAEGVEPSTTVSGFGPSLAKGADSQARSEEGACWWQATDERQSL